MILVEALIGQIKPMVCVFKTGIKPPPSLVNIYKELASDIDGFDPESWLPTELGKQGVLMLNTNLTVEQGKAFSC